MAFATGATGMQETDVEPAWNLGWVTHRKILGDRLGCETLTVDRHLDRFDPLGGCLAGLEHVHVVWIRQRAGHFVFGIVVASDQIDRDSAIAKLGHLLDKELSGSKVFPVSIENISRDQQEIDF